MKTLLVDEMQSGGSELPQYIPMRVDELESPLYNIKESQLKKEKRSLLIKYKVTCKEELTCRKVEIQL